jgi:serine/threonine protein kinase
MNQKLIHNQSIGEIKKINNQLCYIKSYIENETSLLQFCKEISFYNLKIFNKNIMPLLKIESDLKNERLIYPYIENGLNKYIKNIRYTDLIDKFLIPFLTLLEILHENNVIHSDIKIENIRVIDKNETFDFYLHDFGIWKDKLNFNVNPIYSLSQHIAPDLTISPQFDIYSLGTVIYQLIFGYEFIKYYQMNGRNFNNSNELKYIPTKLLQFIKKSTEPFAVNRFQSASEALFFLKNESNLMPNLIFEKYDIQNNFI